jgi:hypothetical protein
MDRLEDFELSQIIVARKAEKNLAIEINLDDL